MNGNCHFIFGAAVGTSIAINLPTLHHIFTKIPVSKESMALLVMGGLLGGLLPDMDNSYSHIGKLTVPVSKLFAASDSGPNHRGILHNPLLYIILLTLSYFYCSPIIGLWIGCLTHTFLDAFNPSGVPFLPGCKLRFAKIWSNKKGSIILTWILTGLILGVGIWMRYGDFLI